jgi:hypothetical protein
MLKSLTDYIIKLYQYIILPQPRIELTTFTVLDTDYKGRCKSNYNVRWDYNRNKLLKYS